MTVRGIGYSPPHSPNPNADQKPATPEKSKWGIGSWLENRVCALSQIAIGGMYFCLFGIKTIFSTIGGFAVWNSTIAKESATGAGTSLMIAANGIKRFFWYHTEKNGDFDKDVLNLHTQAFLELFEQNIKNNNTYVLRSNAGLKTIAYRLLEQTTKEEDKAVAAQKAPNAADRQSLVAGDPAIAEADAEAEKRRAALEKEFLAGKV